jgi:hypothetical protein
MSQNDKYKKGGGNEGLAQLTSHNFKQKSVSAEI